MALLIREQIQDFIKEEDGVGVIEIVLILVVLIGLVIIFKTNIRNCWMAFLRRLISSRKRCINAQQWSYNGISKFNPFMHCQFNVRTFRVRTDCRNEMVFKDCCGFRNGFCI